MLGAQHHSQKKKCVQLVRNIPKLGKDYFTCNVGTAIPRDSYNLTFSSEAKPPTIRLDGKGQFLFLTERNTERAKMSRKWSLHELTTRKQMK